MSETFGQAVRRLRSARGLTQNRLGQLAHITGAYISEIELGRKRPSVDVVRTLDRALHTDGRLTDLARHDPYEPTDQPWTADTARRVLASVAEAAMMDRRGFLVMSGTTVTGLALTWSTAEPGLAVSGTGSVAAETVDQLQGRLVKLWHLDDALGGGACLDAATADLRLVERLLRDGRYSTVVGRGLWSLAAGYARFAGWSAWEAGREACAQRFWHAGLRAAAAAGDTGTGVYVLSNMAVQAATAGDGATAITLVDLARRKTDPADRTVLAMLDCWAARGYALTGDVKATASALGQADDRWGRRRPDDDPSWLYWMPQPSQSETAGIALLHVGDLPAAERCLTAGLANLDANCIRDRQLYLVRIAEVQRRGGRLDEAVGTTHRVVTAAASIDSPRVQTEIGHLIDRMPAAEPAVAELREHRLAVAA